jgi:FdhD protein
MARTASAVSRTVTRIARRDSGVTAAVRAVPEETPVALSYGGSTHAVMMATPADLEDFATGFSLSEGIVADISEIAGIAVEKAGEGIDCQIELKSDAAERLKARRRAIAGPAGCGLCGIESIDEAVRPVRKVGSGPKLTGAEIAQAVALLSKAQKLNAETRAVHAAGLYLPGKGIVAAREDVGRHNALDKLIGACARQGMDSAKGAIVITSRISVEMVQKAAVARASLLIAVSAPTALAIRTAERAGITLVALVRGADFDVYTHPERIALGARADVA